MIKYFIVFSLLSATAVEASEERNRIIYGEDNRVDVTETDAKIQALGKAVAGRVMNFSFKRDDNKISFEDVLTLSHPMSARVCSSERFADQPTVADCTGFLVGEDLLVTAGHCMVPFGQSVRNQGTRDCESFSWLFDYKSDAVLESMDGSQLYGCKEVVAGEYTDELDYAIIKLDRKVSDRTPLKVRKEGKLTLGQSIFVMGHPSGLPLKYADGARVFETEATYFATNLDTFGGNSGSPVFNKDTLEVEGILVRGDTDYVVTTDENGERCRKVNVCDKNRENCTEDDPRILGEHVNYISDIISYL